MGAKKVERLQNEGEKQHLRRFHSPRISDWSPERRLNTRATACPATRPQPKTASSPHYH